MVVPYLVQLVVPYLVQVILSPTSGTSAEYAELVIHIWRTTYPHSY